MKWTHLSTTELVMMSAQTGGIHLSAREEQTKTELIDSERFLRV
jgi:hypothetical protein